MTEATQSKRSHWPIAILSTASAVFNMLLPLVLVRILTTDEVGSFKVFFLYLSVAPAFALTTGVLSGLAYWAGQDASRDRAIQSSACVVLLLALLFGSAAVLFQETIASTFDWPHQQAHWFALALLGAIAAHFFEEAAIARGFIWGGALFFAGFEFVRTIAILCVAYYFRTLESILITHTAIMTTKVAIGLVLGYHLNLVRFRYDPEMIKAVGRYALPVSIAWLFGIFVTSADQILLATHLDASEFAIYSIGCLSIPPILILEQSITRVLIPQLSQAFARGEFMHAAELYRDAVEKIAFLIIPAVVGLIVFAEPIISLLFTPQYAAGAKYLQYFALSYLFLAIPFDAVARARGNAGWILKTFIVFSVFSLLTAYTAIALAGAMGALIAVLTSCAGMRAYSIWYMRREASWKLPDFVPLPEICVMAVCAIGLGAVMYPLRSMFSHDQTWFLVCGPIFGVFYLAITGVLVKRLEIRSRSRQTVLVLVQSLDIGGLERMVVHLCSELDRRARWEPVVLAYDQGEGSENLVGELRARGVAVEAFKKPPRFSVKVVFRIVRSVFMQHVAVVHCQDLGSLIYAVAAKILCLGQIKIVHTQHSFIHLEREKRYSTYERLFTRFVDELVVVSEDTRRTYIDLGFDASRVHLVPNGVRFAASPISSPAAVGDARSELSRSLPPGEVRDRLEAGSADVWLLYLARLFPKKGQDRALELWKALPASYRSRARLVFVGPEAAPGELSRLKELIASVPDKDRIIVAGGTAEPHRWLAASDVYLSCSEFEGMPLGPLEAVGAGLPALLSRIPGHDFLAGFSAQYGLDDPASGAAELCRIMDASAGEELRTRLWAQSESLRKHFSIDSMAASYERIYESALGDRSAREGGLSRPPVAEPATSLFTAVQR